MKYERLTPKILLSDVLKEYSICCVDEPAIGTFGGHNIVVLIDRLVEIEDKIESGELVDCKEVVKECLQILYKRIDCGCLANAFLRGWNEAISTVFKEISEKYGVSMEDEE